MKAIMTFLFSLTTFRSSQAQEAGKDTTSSWKILIGAWSLVAVENILPDKSKVQPYGENPQGLLVFDSKGHYAIQILKALRPKIVANDKNKATSDENAAFCHGAVEVLDRKDCEFTVIQ
ncbi:lipocalin-like domain-containing protein [Dyadobacter sp. CY326]|uniref:lipocalin-like domain-containing protein n=1 Tax=Dyadobacter sp. CY326 TaxID=2907300 RepID=UPI001F194736|nr:lipocalin-like domain-containing protein [Dyadobacter sp. CY326]MCE7067183.1 lipocalin-like domain-containing protein [Dyadobacter sp. CY326]